MDILFNCLTYPNNNIIFYSINIPYIQNKLIEHVFSELFEEIHSKKVNFIKNKPVFSMLATFYFNVIIVLK